MGKYLVLEDVGVAGRGCPLTLFLDISQVKGFLLLNTLLLAFLGPCHEL